MSHCFARLGFENLHYKNVFMSFSVAFCLKKRYRQKRLEILLLLKRCFVLSEEYQYTLSTIVSLMGTGGEH